MRRGVGYSVAQSGSVFGLAAAAVELLNVGFVVAWGRLTGGTNPYTQPQAASSLLFLLGGVVLATLFVGAPGVAGIVAPRHTGRGWSGLFAGPVAGFLDGASAGVVVVVLTFMAPSILVAMYGRTVPHTGQETFALTSVAEFVAGRAAIGAGIGLWGGYRGREQYRRQSSHLAHVQ